MEVDFKNLIPVMVAVVGMFGVVSVPAVGAWLTSKNEIAAAQLVGKRQAYEAFVDFVHSASRGAPQEEHRTAFKKALAIWGSPDAVKAWMDATNATDALASGSVTPEVVFGNVLMALRRDIGHEDRDMPIEALSELLLVPTDASP